LLLLDVFYLIWIRFYFSFSSLIIFCTACFILRVRRHRRNKRTTMICKLYLSFGQNCRRFPRW